MLIHFHYLLQKGEGESVKSLSSHAIVLFIRFGFGNILEYCFSGQWNNMPEDLL